MRFGSPNTILYHRIVWNTIVFAAQSNSFVILKVCDIRGSRLESTRDHKMAVMQNSLLSSGPQILLTSSLRLWT